MICQPMNSNVINAGKIFPFNYQSWIMSEKKLLLVLTAKAKVLREYFQVSLQSHPKKAEAQIKDSSKGRLFLFQVEIFRSFIL